MYQLFHDCFDIFRSRKACNDHVSVPYGVRGTISVDSSVCSGVLGCACTVHVKHGDRCPLRRRNSPSEPRAKVSEADEADSGHHRWTIFEVGPGFRLLIFFDGGIWSVCVTSNRKYAEY